jgi:hemin uptake protein HemP
MLCLKAFQSTLHKIDDVRDLIDASSSREADMEKDDTELARERPSDAPRSPREIHIGELLGETKEAMIIHAGERYRLRITANNKLILTK